MYPLIADVSLMQLNLKELNFQEIKIRYSVAVYKYPGMKVFPGINEFRRKYCFAGKNHSHNHCKQGVGAVGRSPIFYSHFRVFH